MGRRDYYQAGTYNAICDECGFKYKANELVHSHDGLWVCRKCFDPRHPQEAVRPTRTEQYPTETRQDSVVFVEDL
jgi:ribosomal protein L37AE/L43A